jgi:hypothetical protein
LTQASCLHCIIRFLLFCVRIRYPSHMFRLFLVCDPILSKMLALASTSSMALFITDIKREDMLSPMWVTLLH